MNDRPKTYNNLAVVPDLNFYPSTVPIMNSACTLSSDVINQNIIIRSSLSLPSYLEMGLRTTCARVIETHCESLTWKCAVCKCGVGADFSSGVVKSLLTIVRARCTVPSGQLLGIIHAPITPRDRSMHVLSRGDLNLVMGRMRHTRYVTTLVLHACWRCRSCFALHSTFLLEFTNIAGYMELVFHFESIYMFFYL